MSCRRSVASIHALFVAIVAVTLASSCPLGAFAQNANGPSSFLIGTVPADPGTSIAVPLYFTPGTGQPLRSVHLEIEFVSNSVKFDKADKGTASSVQNFDLKVESKELPPDKNLQHTKLAIDVAVTEAGAKKSIPEGLLSFLNFKVPANAKSFAIELKPTLVSALDEAQKPVKATVEPGKIIVSLPDEPMAGCFFFTH
jgi:hypothetical protein